MRITDWDDAYANGAYIDGADDIVAGWAERAAGMVPDEVLPGVDLYLPEGALQGLTVVVHGGYWMAFSGREFAHLAAGPRAAGQAVAMVSYTLAPHARITEITKEVARAVCLAAQSVEGPIRLTGHSAGGHLVTRMVCEGVLPEDVAARIVHVVSISGVHDLRPLLRTKMNETLQLTQSEAVLESPALQTPRPDTRLTSVVGAQERPEFRRQNALLANIWRGLGAETTAVELAGENHFTIIAGLEAPDGALTKLLLG
ncbi:esterase [Jannaschia sp. EhC01]|nr:esterase [Jannaschia sp. EhC01]